MKNILAFKKKTHAEPYMIPLKKENHLTRLTNELLADLLHTSEGRVLSKIIPACQGKKVLFIVPADKPFARQLIVDEKPQTFVQLQFEPTKKESTHLTLTCDTKNIPLKNDLFDIVIACLADTQFNALPLIPELSKVLRPDGLLILTAVHPNLDAMLKNQNPASHQLIENHLEDYFHQMRKNHLYLENLKEGLIQNDVKPYLTLSKEDPNFNDYVGIPLVVCFRFVKYKPHEQ